MQYKDLLMQVEKPARYTGGEYNTPDMKKPHKLSFCLCFADIYEVAMSNLGIAILYDILNNDKDIVCERCFAPWTDMGKLLREEKLPLISLETKKPLRQFDIAGFSLQYEMAYTNILYMLDLAGIPFRSNDRDDSFPLLVAGGPCSVNPEPIADFFDIVFIGEGEEVDKKLCHLAMEHKGNKKALLEAAARIEGIYVPSLSKLEGGINVTPVRKTIIKNLDKAPFPLKPLVPNIEIVHDRAVLELFRGCYAGCRFCQACFFYRPIRYRNKETLKRYAQEMLKNTGYDEIGLSSLSTGDYEDINCLITEIKELADGKNVNLQLPSLRLDSFSAKLMKGARKSSVTFAPEAGTQRLRDVINKNITDEDIDNSMRIAFENGYRTVKLYFMLGLPTETDEDVLGIAEIAERVRKIYFEVTGNRFLKINISTAMFIPKPLTPFQWAQQIEISEMLRRQSMLRAQLRKYKNINFSWHSAEVSMLEGVFARGDRKLSYLVESAYKNGCYFDGWSELFNYENWQKAIDECGINVSEYTRERQTYEDLPWDFIDFGVTKAYLLKEYKKALQGETTPPCKQKCQGCGAERVSACRRYEGGIDA